MGGGDPYLAPLSRGKVVEPPRPYAEANEPQGGQPDRGGHAANLAVASFR